MDSRFKSERWILTIEYPSLVDQEESDPELEFPYDYVSRVVKYVGEHWGGLPEELEKFCEWTNSTVKITADTLDPFCGLMEYILMDTIPDKLVLE